MSDSDEDKCKPGQGSKEAKDAADDEPLPEEHSKTSRHAIELGGTRLEYDATASTVHLRDDKGRPRASIFSVAYVRAGDARPERPVTFCFNGGPGSSSVWLHLGAFGPKRVAFPDPAAPPPPPHRLVDNESSLLDLTDLVFIDPVGTGYSRALGRGKTTDFLAARADTESVADFVRIWTTRHRRWNSPRYFAGESFGGTRVASLVPYLADRGMFANGALLISPALDFGALEFGPDNDLPSVLYLPTYAATAWYHGKLDPRPADLRAFIASVREFAITRYAPALFRGARLPRAERESLVAELARMTGLSPGWIERNDLRIDNGRYAKELLAESGLVVGRLDSRFVGHDLDRGRDSLAEDPSFSAPHGPYSALLNEYVRGELGFEEERPYEVLNMKVNESWTWEMPKGKTGGYLNVVGELRRAMLANPHLRVFFANGLYDMATPFFAAEHAASHLGAEAHVRKNLTEAFYDAGHMMYLHAASRLQLKEDLRAFYAAGAAVE